MLRTVTLLACVAALAACGQMSGAKGPDSSASTSAASTSAPPAADSGAKPDDGAAAPAAAADNSGPKPAVEQAPTGSTPDKP